MTKTKGFGWQPDLPDHRDLGLDLAALADVEVPKTLDLRPQCPPVYDQGALGSCTAQAVCAVLQYTEMAQAQGKRRPVPSRLFVYYNTRVLQNTVASDSGGSLRNALKAVAKFGYCPEALLPYSVQGYDIEPSAADYSDALDHRLGPLMYARVPVTQLRLLLSAGHLVVLGFPVYESFAPAPKTGTVPLPKKTERLLGGHAVALCGYDQGRFLARNSWGPRWGDKGYFWFPVDYVLRLASDFWTVSQVPALEKTTQ